MTIIFFRSIYFYLVVPCQPLLHITKMTQSKTIIMSASHWKKSQKWLRLLKNFWKSFRWLAGGFDQFLPEVCGIWYSVHMRGMQRQFGELAYLNRLRHNTILNKRWCEQHIWEFYEYRHNKMVFSDINLTWFFDLFVYCFKIQTERKLNARCLIHLMLPWYLQTLSFPTLIPYLIREIGIHCFYSLLGPQNLQQTFKVEFFTPLHPH